MGLLDEAEGEARLILERVGFDIYDAPGAWKIVASTLGPRALRRLPARKLAGAEGECCRVGDEYRIYVRSDLAPARASFVALHELAHVHLGELRHGDPELEERCDAIAGALVCPRGAFGEAVKEHGEQWEQLALDFGVETCCAALRYGEVLNVPLCLVSPASVRVRGREWGWPRSEREIRRLAKGRGLPPGLVAERLPDDPRRTLLLADTA